MDRRKIYVLLCITGIFLLTVSCVKDLNFDQLDEVEIAPVFEVDFFYSRFNTEDYLPEDVFIDPSIIIPPISLQDTVNYDLISSSFSGENLEKIELMMEVRNTIESEFIMQFQFLTDNDEPLGTLYAIDIQEGVGSGTNPVSSFLLPDPTVLDTNTLNQLANAKKIAVEIITPSLNSNLKGTLDVRSKAAYYINYKL